MLSFFEQYHIPLESHPYYPDLNPTEHAWVLLKRQVHIEYPWIGNYPGGPQKVKGELAEILPVCWGKIPPSSSRLCGSQCLTMYRQPSRQGVVHLLLIPLYILFYSLLYLYVFNVPKGCIME